MQLSGGFGYRPALLISCRAIFSAYPHNTPNHVPQMIRTPSPQPVHCWGYLFWLLAEFHLPAAHCVSIQHISMPPCQQSAIIHNCDISHSHWHTLAHTPSMDEWMPMMSTVDLPDSVKNLHTARVMGLCLPRDISTWLFEPRDRYMLCLLGSRL